MPIKKTTLKAAATKKDALKKLTVPALRAKAKRAGIKLSKTDGSQKTKAQLVLALDKVPAPKKKTTTRKTSLARKPASTKMVGTSDTRRDMKRQAEPPGKRLSKNEHVYYERRANRSDINQDKWPLLDNGYKYSNQFERIQIVFNEFSHLLDMWYLNTNKDITTKLLDIPELRRDVEGIEYSLRIASKILRRYDTGLDTEDYDPYEDD